jgi:DNA polymerase-4
MDRFHGCYQWTNELSQSITKKQDCLALHYRIVNKTVFKIGTGESKPIGKLEIPETMVKTF